MSKQANLKRRMDRFFGSIIELVKACAEIRQILAGLPTGLPVNLVTRLLSGPPTRHPLASRWKFAAKRECHISEDKIPRLIELFRMQGALMTGVQETNTRKVRDFVASFHPVAVSLGDLVGTSYAEIAIAVVRTEAEAAPMHLFLGSLEFQEGVLKGVCAALARDPFQSAWYTETVVDLAKEYHSLLTGLEELSKLIMDEPDDLENMASEQFSPDAKPIHDADRPRSSKASLDGVAIAIDERKGWQVFRRGRSGWEHQGPLRHPPKKGHESSILESFVDAGGSLSIAQLVQKLRPKFSPAERRQFFIVSLKPAISRLRQRLRRSLNLPNGIDPVPWQREISGYRLMVEIGFVEKDDDGRSQFSQRNPGGT